MDLRSYYFYSVILFSSGILLAKHDKMNFDALQSSIDVINATNAVALNVTKFAVKSGSIMEHCKFFQCRGIPLMFALYLGKEICSWDICSISEWLQEEKSIVTMQFYSYNQTSHDLWYLVIRISVSLTAQRERGNLEGVRPYNQCFASTIDQKLQLGLHLAI